MDKATGRQQVCLRGRGRGTVAGPLLWAWPRGDPGATARASLPRPRDGSGAGAVCEVVRGPKGCCRERGRISAKKDFLLSDAAVSVGV